MFYILDIHILGDTGEYTTGDTELLSELRSIWPLRITVGNGH
jgi:hypothetical protein